MLDFFIEDSLHQIVGAVVLTSGQVADVSIAPHCASLSFHQHGQHRLDIGRVFRQAGGGTSGAVMELHHALGQFATELVDARNQGLKMVAVFDSGGLGNLFDCLTLQSDQIHP